MTAWLTQTDIAHRGLFKKGTEREENTLAAIVAAVDAGYAAEFDVRITGDGEIVSFHDATLDRMPGAPGTLRDMRYEELATIAVGRGKAPMPLLGDVLAAVDGRQTLVIEIKTEEDSDIEAVGTALVKALDGYTGNYAVMAFDPRIIKWYADNQAAVLRGMVLHIREGEDLDEAMVRHEQYCDYASAQFVSHDIKTLPTPFTTAWRADGKSLICWTVRTSEDEAKGRRFCDALTFEPPAVTG